MSRLLRVFVTVVVGLAAGACAGSFRQTCTNLGYVEGTLEHAGCTERERERFGAAMQGLSNSLNETNRQLQQQQYQRQQQYYQQQQLYQQQQIINQMNRPRNCYGTRYGYSWSATCY